MLEFFSIFVIINIPKIDELVFCTREMLISGGWDWHSLLFFLIGLHLDPGAVSFHVKKSPFLKADRGSPQPCFRYFIANSSGKNYANDGSKTFSQALSLFFDLCLSCSVVSKSVPWRVCASLL